MPHVKLPNSEHIIRKDFLCITLTLTSQQTTPHTPLIALRSTNCRPRPNHLRSLYESPYIPRHPSLILLATQSSTMSESSSPTRTELSCPPSPLSLSFQGYIATTVDAVKVALAARYVQRIMQQVLSIDTNSTTDRNGMIPRSVRRLTKSEQATMVKSGAIFVFSPEECGKLFALSSGASHHIHKHAYRILVRNETLDR